MRTTRRSIAATRRPRGCGGGEEADSAAIAIAFRPTHTEGQRARRRTACRREHGGTGPRRHCHLFLITRPAAPGQRDPGELRRCSASCRDCPPPGCERRRSCTAVVAGGVPTSVAVAMPRGEALTGEHSPWRPGAAMVSPTQQCGLWMGPGAALAAAGSGHDTRDHPPSRALPNWVRAAAWIRVDCAPAAARLVAVTRHLTTTTANLPPRSASTASSTESTRTGVTSSDAAAMLARAGVRAWRPAVAVETRCSRPGEALLAPASVCRVCCAPCRAASVWTRAQSCPVPCAASSRCCGSVCGARPRACLGERVVECECGWSGLKGHARGRGSRPAGAWLESVLSQDEAARGPGPGGGARGPGNGVRPRPPLESRSHARTHARTHARAWEQRLAQGCSCSLHWRRLRCCSRAMGR